MKKALKAAFALTLVLSLAFCLTGCGEAKKAEKAVDSFFTALHDCNLDEADKYAVMDDEDADDSDSIFSSEDEEDDPEWDAITKNLFGSIEHDIKSSEKVSSDEVTVTVELTVNDMKEFFAAYLQESFANAFSDMSEEELSEKMAEFINGYEYDTTTDEYEVTVKNTDGEWKVIFDDDLQDAVTGGLLAAAAEMEESMNTDS